MCCWHLQQAEIDFDCGHHRDRLAVLSARFEPPPADGLKGLFIEAETETFDHLHILRGSIGADRRLDYYRALHPGPPCLLAILGLNLVSQRRCSDSTANVERSHSGHLAELHHRASQVFAD